MTNARAPLPLPPVGRLGSTLTSAWGILGQCRRLGPSGELGRAGLVGLFALLACSGEETPQTPGPPAAIHGAVVIEPNDLRVGDLLTLEITVVTPPGHRVRPVELSETIAPLWLLDAEALPVQRSVERWTHTTRVRARVRQAPGRYNWPEQEITVESPEGKTKPLVLAAREFRVASVSDAVPDRLEPFGLRVPEPVEGGGGGLGHGLLGSAATLLLLGAIHGARRWRSRQRIPRAAPDSTPPWTVADRELEAALARAVEDPHGAADGAAQTLRRYVHRRANRPIETLTTEEIACQRPPGRLRSRWPDLVDLLRRLDSLRFPGDLDGEAGRASLRDCLADARQFVSDSIPPRELR